MSYKTNAKALRLGISHDWRYKGHGSIPNLHLDRRLAQYVSNLVEYVVPQAPRRAKTKGRQKNKIPPSPGIQGKALVLRGGNRLMLCFSYYLNLKGATELQKQRFDRNVRSLQRQLSRECHLRVDIRCYNYYALFWRLQLFSGRRSRRRAQKGRGQLREAFRRHRFLQMERAYYGALATRLRLVRTAVRRWRRQRYYKRSLQPILAAFLASGFDGDMAAKAIALELQILRIYHKRFMRYARRLLWMAFHHWQRPSLLQGLRMEIRGRMTDHRRQVRRAQTKTTRYGSLKRSSLLVNSSHCRYLAYNRYGVISVTLTYQLHQREAEVWEDRLAQSPLRAFSVLEPLELWTDWRDSPLPPDLSLRHPTYERDPTALLDNHRWLEELERRAAANPSAEGKVAPELVEQPLLEILNRRWCYPHRLRWRGLSLRRPDRLRLLLRPKRLSLGDGYSQPHLFPVRRGILAPFQLELQRQQLLSLRLRQGHPRRPDGRGPTVPLSLRQRWHSDQPGTLPTHRPVPRQRIQPFDSRTLIDRYRHPWRRLRRRWTPPLSNIRHAR